MPREKEDDHTHLTSWSEYTFESVARLVAIGLAAVNFILLVLVVQRESQ
jgi:hypothetical protein